MPAKLRLRLFPRAESAVLRGHPWVFSDGVKEQNRPGEPGEIAVLYDRSDRFLALGFFDPLSPIRLRVFQVRRPVPVGEALWRERIRCARALRESSSVFASGTTGGRWINGESDALPGLVVDRYDTTLVVKIYIPAWLGLLDSLEAALREELHPGFLMLRLSRNLAGLALERWGVSEGFRGDPGPDPVVFEENGLLFEAQVRLGQKTGFFLDQRENRQRVGEMSHDRDVLNVFSYSGGFSVYAARAGARSVTDLDISGHALESARRNFRLNASASRLPPVEHHCLQADAFEWLRSSPASTYGVVVLDPPSLAPREANRSAALEGYAALAAGGIRVLRRDGILVSASCSSHVHQEEFFDTVRRTAHRSGRRVRELWTSGHAPDHPATFPEAHYLKAICLHLD